MRLFTQMVSNTFCCQEIDEIRQYINQTLCEQDQLMTGYFPLTEQLLLREGKPCGIFFCLHGPRSLQLTAVWDVLGGHILFYGSRGERFRTTRLTGTVIKRGSPFEKHMANRVMNDP